MHRKFGEGHGYAVLGNESERARINRSQSGVRTKTTMAGSPASLRTPTLQP